jgi:L-alanine-DL-glutamate epimerase-like enolase superfamily enzyme
LDGKRTAFSRELDGARDLALLPRRLAENGMRITDLDVIAFEGFIDRHWFGSFEADHRVVQTVTRIHTDAGVEGYCLGGHFHGDADGLSPDHRAALTTFVKAMLIGRDPFDREEIWRQMWAAKVPENILSVVDLALWDLAGRATGLPVHKMLGGCRSKVKAYASTFGNMGRPDVYAQHALDCLDQGFKAYKIHPYHRWDPKTGEPAEPGTSFIDWDIAICEAVRAAVGDRMALMLDPWGTYHRYEDALKVGRALERLDFYWYEHPMPEHKVDAYVRLADALSVAICSPEVAEGSIYTRAEWIRRRASDMSRIDVLRGGITGVMKMAAVCDAFGMQCELHMSGFGNLQVLGATSENVCEYYEIGLLGPGARYHRTPHHLRAPCDVMDSDGYVTVPTGPGLGYDIDWDFIENHRVVDTGEGISPMLPR